MINKLLGYFLIWCLFLLSIRLTFTYTDKDNDNYCILAFAPKHDNVLFIISTHLSYVVYL